MTPRYDACTQRVGAIQQAFDALLEALDAYEESLSAQLGRVPEEQAGTLGLALRMQRDGVRRMRNDIETQILDDFIRFADRMIRVKHAEEGTFV